MAHTAREMRMSSEKKPTVISSLVADDRSWTYLLTDVASNIELSEWKISNLDLGLSTPFRVVKRTLHGGKQEGSTLVTIETEHLTTTIIPSRGMSILDARSGDLRLGWDSPVSEVVNPVYVDLQARGGLGWLDGFNELLVRCGTEWLGTPCVDDGRLNTLHGRIGNTPASSVVVQIEKVEPHRITIFGLLRETTFKFSQLTLMTAFSVQPGCKFFTITDKLTNESDYAQEYQYLYHTNFGRPILEENAKVYVPVKEVTPMNDYAASELDRWSIYKAPTPGFDEKCFNLEVRVDGEGRSLAALVNAGDTAGVVMRYSTGSLPAFTLWKNTDTDRQGYVTGLEPGTNFPFSKTIERKMGRVRKLGPHESIEFGLSIEVLASSQQVSDIRDEVSRLQGVKAPILASTPRCIL